MSKALDKLTCRLCDYGLGIADEDFEIARGYWAHSHQDCLRWQLNAPMADPKSYGADGRPVLIGIDSWDTIGQCAKYGFWLTRGSDGYGQYTALAKLPGRNPPEEKDIVTIEEFKKIHGAQQ